MKDLADRREMDAEFDRIMRDNAQVRAVTKMLGSVGISTCREWFALGFLAGQTDSLRYHTESMKQKLSRLKEGAHEKSKKET